MRSGKLVFLSCLALTLVPSQAWAGTPQAALGPYESVSSTAVRLVGFVNPHGTQTTYRFEYGPEDCGLAACQKLPVGEEPSAGEDVKTVRVWQEASGLSPGTTYRYRLVATSEEGSVASEDGTFSTLESPGGEGSCPNEAERQQQSAGFLPDCRAYERVSTLDPATRNGADVLVNSQAIRSAVDGTALEFSASAAAGGAESLPISTDYIALRRPGEGWVVHGITPPQRGMTLFEVVFGLQPRYVGDFSPDLSKGVFLSNSLLSLAGENVRDVRNLYLREGLRATGGGADLLLSDSFAPIPAERSYVPTLDGTSADFSHVLFESTANLTPEATGLGPGTRLYEWVDGELHMVGRLPAGEGGGPTLAQAGRGGSKNNYTPHVISADGSRVVFTRPPFKLSGLGGNLYLRDDHHDDDPLDDTIVKINQSEKEGGDPHGPQPAILWTATPDLSQIFFTTTEALTDDASSESPESSKLYRYRPDVPEGERLTLISVDRDPEDSITDEGTGVIGTSNDGDYVYFTGSNQLLPGGSSSKPLVHALRIFVWHNGEIHEVAALNSQEELRRTLGSSSWQSGPQWARVTPDGTHLLFLTEGTGETGEFEHGEACPSLSSTRCLEVYVYSALGDPGRLQCASCPQDHSSPTADADFNARSASPVIRGDQHLNHAISDDGRYVFFSTAQQLAPGDLNGAADAYRFDTVTGSVQPLTPGQPTVGSHFVEASPSGNDAFVVTRSPLVASDQDENADVYDVRVDGGFMEASGAEPACASEESCRPPQAGDPLAGPPPSASLASPPRAGHRHRHRRHRARHRGHGAHRKHRQADHHG
jgi:hypothetical protein